MLGLRNLSDSRLSTTFMVVSVAMFISGLALVPSDSASIVMVGIWIVASLALIGVWIAVAVELTKRFFGGGRYRQMGD